jgi:hypothetical protein
MIKERPVCQFGDFRQRVTCHRVFLRECSALTFYIYFLRLLSETIQRAIVRVPLSINAGLVRQAKLRPGRFYSLWRRKKYLRAIANLVQRAGGH